MTTPRAYWKGYLKLSLVTCSVALYPASSQSEKTHFHQINRKTGNRLRQQMVDEKTGRVVEGDSKARGYELKRGSYIEIEPEELEAVEVESTRTIDIDKFVPEEGSRNTRLGWTNIEPQAWQPPSKKDQHCSRAVGDTRGYRRHDEYRGGVVEWRGLKEFSLRRSQDAH
jgi:hypothetical protein